MPHRITGVDVDSPAHRLGIQTGDILCTLQDETVMDWIDYQALSTHRRVTIGIKRDGELLKLVCRKGEYESLGLNFERSLMSCVRECGNHCEFCFVEQLPKNLRDTLYVRDDDWRMSMMMGNYVTLTNVGPRELSRIIRRHASPLYISVHATDPEVRKRMIGHPRAGDMMQQLERLAEGGIDFHTQAVVCPGVNDGAVLDQTIQTLSALYPACRSLAIVPVGLTKFREGLPVLEPYHEDTARATLELAHAWQQKLLEKIGTRFIFASDEFYLKAGLPMPPEEAYEGYPQIENGVGMLRQMEDEFKEALLAREGETPKAQKVLIATGISAAPFLRRIIQEAHLEKVSVEVMAVENTFFGPTVTVAGLLTCGDLKRALQGKQADAVLISSSMLRDGGHIFLDDGTLDELRGATGLDVRPICVTGEALVEALFGG